MKVNDIATQQTAYLPLHELTRGLPRNLRIRMLENDLTPILSIMIAFVQRYRLQDGSEGYCDVAEWLVSSQDKKINELVTMVNEITWKQQKLGGGGGV